MTKKTKVLVLGATGMLGSMLMKVGHARADIELSGTVRNQAKVDQFDAAIAPLLIDGVDAEDLDCLKDLVASTRPDVIINAVGLIKQRGNSSEVLSALTTNSMLPHQLAEVCAPHGTRIIQISTDCVFSGKRGMYTEGDLPDARDVYGLSKYLGELNDTPHTTIRTSIIGPELKSDHTDGLSLLDWFLSQSGEVKGFRGAVFSGFPTVELAQIIYDIVIPRREMTGLWHISAEPIDKFELLNLIRTAYGNSIEIVPVDEPKIDRSLDSSRFRAATGYRPPDWPELISAMRAADGRSF